MIAEYAWTAGSRRSPVGETRSGRRRFAIAICVLIAGGILLMPAIGSAQPPNPPINLTVLVVPTAPPFVNLRFQWSPPVSGPTVTDYILEIGTTPGGTEIMRASVGNVTDVTAPPRVLIGVRYYARVRARNTSGESAPSNEVTVLVPCEGPPAGATNISWRPLNATDVQVVWDTVIPGLTWNVDVFRLSNGTLEFAGQPTPPTRRAITLTLESGSHLVRVIGTSGCGGSSPPQQIIVSSGNPPGSAPVVINEFDGFVELKNISATTIDVGRWRLMTAISAEKAVVTAATIPASTTIAPGCSYLLAPSSTVAGVSVDLVTSTAGSGYAIVSSSGQIVDSAAYADAVSTNAPTPFGEGGLLPPITTGSYERRGPIDSNDNISDFTYRGVPTPANAAACRAEVAPGPPSDLTANVAGSVVTLSWTPPPGTAPTGYRLEAGSFAGSADSAIFDLAAPATTISFAGVPNGNYYVRIRALNAFGISGASNEILVTVCGAGCTAPPGAVTDLALFLSGRNVVLVWRGPTTGPTPTGYLIEAGSAPGLANLARVATGSTAESATAVNVPPGVYYVRVRAMNGSALGPPSNEVIIVIQ